MPSPSPIYLTPLIPLSFKGEGEGYGREALPPLNPPLPPRSPKRVLIIPCPSSGVFKRGAAPLSNPPLPLGKGKGTQGIGFLPTESGRAYPYFPV